MEANIDFQTLKSISSHIVGFPNIAFAAEGVTLTGEEVRKNSLFVPIGEDEELNRQALIHAVENGAAGSLWKEGTPFPEHITEKIPIFLVDDPSSALKKLADIYFEEVDPTVVAISGCEGRTYTKELAAHVLQKNYTIVKSENINMNVEQLCSFIFNMDRSTTLFICEYNVENGVELIQFLKPQFLAFTDITPELLSAEEIFSTFVNMERILKPTANVLIDGDDERFAKYAWQTDIAMCGYGEHNLFQIEHVEKKEDHFIFQIKGVYQPFTIQGDDENLVKYALFVIGLSIQLGLFANEIEEKMKEFHLENDR